ncbi:MAG: hypothetical protein KGI38_03045 [Thaumarchaeota archaeon]|nr:hypothetical protein [Nitrososphaerota archaeon]
MVRRRGIGASAASAVIFSVLLVSNLAVYVASQDRARLYAQADGADSLGDSALILAWAGGADILIEAQSFLAGSAFGCSTAVSQMAQETGSLIDHQRGGGVDVTTTASLVQGGTTGDNMSFLSPYEGSVSGSFDVSLHMVATGALPGSGVTLQRSETHLVHLDFHLSKLTSDCAAAVAAITSSTSSADLPNCTAASMAPLMGRASQGPASDASQDGFEFSLAYGITSSPSCSVDFVVSLEQDGIQGVSGTFSVRMEEGASVSIGIASPPRA